MIIPSIFPSPPAQQKKGGGGFFSTGSTPSQQKPKPKPSGGFFSTGSSPAPVPPKPDPTTPVDPDEATVAAIKDMLAKRYSEAELAVLQKKLSQLLEKEIRIYFGNAIHTAAQGILRKFPKSSFLITGSVKVRYDGSKRKPFEAVLHKLDIKFLDKSGSQSRKADAKKIIEEAIKSETALYNTDVAPELRAIIPGTLLIEVPLKQQASPSKIKVTTDRTFARDVLKNTKPVLVEFKADWCGPCKIMKPIIVKLAKKYNGQLEVFELDTDYNKQIPKKYKVDGIPVFLLFKGGRVIGRVTGAVPEWRIETLLKKGVGTGPGTAKPKPPQPKPQPKPDPQPQPEQGGGFFSTGSTDTQ